MLDAVPAAHAAAVTVLILKLYSSVLFVSVEGKPPKASAAEDVPEGIPVQYLEVAKVAGEVE